MYSKAKIAGHPIHPMLVAFPITFYTLSLIAFFVFDNVRSDMFWYHLGYFSTYAGVGTALLAAVPGFIDWAAGIPRNSAAKTRGFIHMVLNVTALVLFAINAVRLYGTWATMDVDTTGLWVMALLGFVLTMAAGWHGWEMIATHKIGVNMTPEQERLEPVEKMSPREHQGLPAHPRPI